MRLFCRGWIQVEHDFVDLPVIPVLDLYVRIDGNLFVVLREYDLLVDQMNFVNIIVFLVSFSV